MEKRAMSTEDQRTPAPDGSATAARKTLQDMLWGYRFSQAIYVAAKLGLADLLKDGPKSYAELATAAGAHPGALYRLLRMLASVDIFAEVGQGKARQNFLYTRAD
jgi:Dimerisation domain